VNLERLAYSAIGMWRPCSYGAVWGEPTLLFPAQSVNSEISVYHFSQRVAWGLGSEVRHYVNWSVAKTWF
jgi:hypothetical protein